MKATKLTPEQKEANKLARKEAREQAKELARIEAEKKQKPVSKIEIQVIWKKSATWGMCPSAEASVWYKDGTFARVGPFKCSGCGYDKLSTVVADVFNETLKYKLYNESIINSEKKPYGVRADEYKHFDGGIGVNCYYAISKFIGGTFVQTYNGKSEDCFTYTDNE